MTTGNTKATVRIHGIDAECVCTAEAGRSAVYRICIGTYQHPGGLQRENLSDFAAWWWDIQVEPHQAPMYLYRSAGRQWITVESQGVCTAAYTQSHFGGMPCGQSVEPSRHKDVGRVHRLFRRLYPYDAARLFIQKYPQYQLALGFMALQDLTTGEQGQAVAHYYLLGPDHQEVVESLR